MVGLQGLCRPESHGRAVCGFENLPANIRLPPSAVGWPGPALPPACPTPSSSPTAGEQPVQDVPSWGLQGPQSRAVLPHSLPLQSSLLPQLNRGEMCTHRLTVPSGGAILPWWPWGARGALWPGDRLCTRALHHWAYRTLGGAEGTGWGAHHCALQLPGLGSGTHRVDMRGRGWWH